MEPNKPAGDDSFANEEDGDFAAARIREVEAMRMVKAAANEAAGRLDVVQFLNGAEWIRNVALFTAVNTVIALFGARIRLIFGLGAAEVVNAVGGHIAADAGSGMLVIPLGISLLLAGVFLGLYKAAAARHKWAFWLAMGLYVADVGVFVMINDPLEVACHGYALYQMWCGLQGLRQLEAKG